MTVFAQRIVGAVAAWLVALALVATASAQGMRPAPGQEPSDFMKQQQMGNRIDANNADVWRSVRKGVEGYASIPDPRAGVLVQSEGEQWRAFYRGPLKTYGGWFLGAVVLALAVFYVLRGRIRIDAGPSRRQILRFGDVDRFVHWLTAVSFILLALTGLNVTFGRFVVLPWLGPSAFSALTDVGKLVHNYVGFAFIAGVIMTLVIWVKDNVPSGADLAWLLKGGGLLSRGSHLPARKFNGGQKLIFWTVVIGGGVLAYTGLNLMFPFTWGGMKDMQFAVLLHAGVAIAMIGIIIGHIYIGTLGMEGAFDAMATGYVDENWAREHHSIWVAETLGEPVPGEGGAAHGSRQHA